jgi:hypothetical protein
LARGCFSQSRTRLNAGSSKTPENETSGSHESVQVKQLRAEAIFLPQPLAPERKVFKIGSVEILHAPKSAIAIYNHS